MNGCGQPSRMGFPAQSGDDMVDGAYSLRMALLAGAAIGCGMGAAAAADLTNFTAGDIVISTTSGVIDNGASPIALKEFGLGAAGQIANYVGSLTLPTETIGANSAISGELGSSSEGFLQLSANGKLLTIGGYGVNAAAFNTAALSVYGTAALAQTTSLVGGQYVTVPRVVAAINADAQVDTSTALTGVFNGNNIRSVATVDGSSFYVSGQGASKSDTATQGVFFAKDGATTATGIDNTTDTRVVEIINGTLYVSRDRKPVSGANNSTNISTLTPPGGGLPTSSAGLTTTRVIPGAASVTGGNTASIDLTAATANGVNNSRIGKFVYLSPEQYFLASPDVMYVTDSGFPKNGSANAAGLGDGGLQKWMLESGVWTLEYTLHEGLDLVDNATAGGGASAPGVTGLFGLTARVVNGEVELFATTYGLNDLSPDYLYEITDALGATSGAGESFHLLYAAGPNEQIGGVAFAPSVPEASTWAMLSLGFAGLGFAGLRRARRTAAAA